jgi:hypothetical protein
MPVFAYGHRTLRMLFKKSYADFDSFWQEPIIVIKKQNVFTLTVAQSGIAGSLDPLITLIDIGDRVILSDRRS